MSCIETIMDVIGSEIYGLEKSYKDAAQLVNRYMPEGLCTIYTRTDGTDYGEYYRREQRGPGREALEYGADNERRGVREVASEDVAVTPVEID